MFSMKLFQKKLAELTVQAENSWKKMPPYRFSFGMQENHSSSNKQTVLTAKLFSFLVLTVIYAAEILFSGCSRPLKTPENSVRVCADITEQSAAIETETFGIDRTGNYRNLVKKKITDYGKVRIFCPALSVPPETPDKSGECTVIISPEGKVLVIDAGHPLAFRHILLLLKDLKINEIECLVLTHPHIDHAGGIPALCAALPVKKCYYMGLYYPTRYYEDFLRTMESHKITVKNVRAGDVIELGKYVQFKVLWPLKGEFKYPQDFPQNSTQFINDQSLCLKMLFGNSSALFCGDLYRSAERKLIGFYKDELQSQVLKTNHHGNDTSNSLSWIKTVKPEIVYASNDAIGSMSVYKNYTDAGAEFFHSAENGLVKISMGRNGFCSVKVQKKSWMND